MQYDHESETDTWTYMNMDTDTESDIHTGRDMDASWVIHNSQYQQISDQQKSIPPNLYGTVLYIDDRSSSIN
jgi:hypothetical protein